MEGLIPSNIKGQNANDEKAYNKVNPKDRKYLTRMITPNKKISFQANGKTIKAEAYIAERAFKAETHPTGLRAERLMRLYRAVVRRNGLRDTDLARGHNVYYSRNGRLKDIKAGLVA